MTAANSGRIAAYATGAALFAWFVSLISPGLSSWFDGDDLLNLYYYWSRPWAALIKANFAFWSTYYRPAGGLFYRLIYSFWGFHPLPFRIVIFAFLCVNFGLLALVVWQLTGSRWSPLVALFVIAIHPTFVALYFDNGTVYDILAYTFFWTAVALYVRVRNGGRLPGWGSSAFLLVLFIAALDSKEISVLLPVAVGLYELIWHPPARWNPSSLWRWIVHEGRFAAIGGMLDAVFVAGKRYGPDSLWNLSSYRPVYSLPAYFESHLHYIHDFYPALHTLHQVMVLLCVMLVLTAVSRRRSMIWGAAFILLGMLPLAFIPGRGGFAYYVPSIGWAVYIGGLVDWLVELLSFKRIWLRAALQAALLLFLFVKVAPWQQKWIIKNAEAAHDLQARFRNYRDQIRALIPAPRRGARILLLADAEGRDDFDIYFTIRLLYKDHALEAERMTLWRQRHVEVNPASYDYVLDWVNGRFVLVSHK